MKFSIPWRFYFQQLFAEDTYIRFINPFNFWHKHKIKHLEKCSELDLIEHLERCYQKKCPQAKTITRRIKPNYRVPVDDLNFSKPILFDRLFIVQFSENLKYRGIVNTENRT